jgi:hypothetical protein
MGLVKSDEECQADAEDDQGNEEVAVGEDGSGFVRGVHLGRVDFRIDGLGFESGSPFDSRWGML